jgi:hypothetical protein
MPRLRIKLLAALLLSLVLHAGLLAPWATIAPPTPAPPLQVRLVEAPVPERKQIAPAIQKLPTKPIQARPRDVANTEKVRVMDDARPTSAPDKPPATLPAPAAPSAEEWQLASTYTLRNSKRYRHNWGQQVRSMMGTAVEGPDQGMVRFRIEIAPDGKIAKVEELWSTSALASKLASEAIQNLPPLPPTPTGKPLVFEQTISFLPYETGWPPSYKLDCLPEPQAFKNPFAWDGSSPPSIATPSHRPSPPDGCPPDSTADTIEEEERELKRQMDQWRWGR